ncbi:MAG: serine/threonine protein kinase [Deltaproteobacteria bacterium]|nr:serine/threonine protein kinase [Deltaproteobacteria bacterium]
MRPTGDGGHSSVGPRSGLPERIGPYRIRGILGRGSMAVVFDALSPDGEPVALKVLQAPDDPERSEALTKRFLREAKILSRLNHRSIVRLFDAGEAEDNLYLAMQRIEGVSLRDLRRNGPVGLDDLLALAIDICDALAHLHAHGVVHRDLKPANIMIDSSGRPVIADFGISRSDELTGVTQQGDVLGSPGYIAPELIDGVEPSAASDQYAIGRLFFELGALGSAPRLPTGVPVYELLARGLEIDWSRWPTGAGWEGLGEALQRALAGDPRARFESMTAFKDALSAILHGDGPEGTSTAPELPPFETAFEARTQRVDTSGIAPLPPEVQPSHWNETPGAATDVEQRPARGLKLPSPSQMRSEGNVEEARPLAAMVAQRESAAPAARPSAVPVEEVSALGGGASAGATSERHERQIAAMREQVASVRREAKRQRLIAAAIAAVAGAGIGLFIGLAVPHGPAPVPTVIVVPPADAPFSDLRFQLKPGETAGPSATDLADAQNMLSSARESLKERDFEGATRYLGLCIEIGDLPDCHKLLAAFLSLTRDPAARTHLEHYLRIAPAAPDATHLREVLEGKNAPSEPGSR